MGRKEMTSELTGTPFQNQGQIQNKCVSRGKTSWSKGNESTESDPNKKIQSAGELPGDIITPHWALSLGPVPQGYRWWTLTYFLWNRTTGSASKSVTSSFLPFSMTSRCLRTNSQPMCEKKKPRRALCGSASVSEYLWWTRWSLDHSKMSFCREKADLSEGVKHPGVSWKLPNFPHPPAYSHPHFHHHYWQTCTHP